MDRIGKLLPGVIARQTKGGAIGELRVRMVLEQILGPSLAPQVLEAEMRGGVLTVSTANPALAHQLRLDADVIIGRINGEVTGRRVRELRVRSGRH